MHALVSVHDVMPHTLEPIGRLLDLLRPYPTQNICLLVVPGRPWTPTQIDQLRRWQDEGFELAGHGWLHETDRITTLYHRLHSTFVSRNVAEHLSLSTAELVDLMERNFGWWIAHRFDPPSLYVPPAWAMGNIALAQLSQLPFRTYELSWGLYDAATGASQRLPLIGFEADRWWRTLFLRPWNALNGRLATAGRPVRLSLHPYDLDLQLGHTLPGWLDRVTTWVNYRDLFKKT